MDASVARKLVEQNKIDKENKIKEKKITTEKIKKEATENARIDAEKDYEYILDKIKNAASYKKRKVKYNVGDIDVENKKNRKLHFYHSAMINILKEKLEEDGFEVKVVKTDKNGVWSLTNKKYNMVNTTLVIKW